MTYKNCFSIEIKLKMNIGQNNFLFGLNMGFCIFNSLKRKFDNKNRSSYGILEAILVQSRTRARKD